LFPCHQHSARPSRKRREIVDTHNKALAYSSQGFSYDGADVALSPRVLIGRPYDISQLRGLEWPHAPRLAKPAAGRSTTQSKDT
jgi:hypothetical protein